MPNLIERFWSDESGATAIEYGLLAALMGIGLVAGLTQLKTALITLFSSVDEQIPDAG